MSYLESVVNQNKKHYQYIYEGKSNYMHIFGVYFIFDWSHIHRKENCRSILYSWKLGPCLAVSEEGKTKLVMLETSIFPYAHWQESCLGNAFWLMNREGSTHTLSTNGNTSAHVSQPGPLASTGRHLSQRISDSMVSTTGLVIPLTSKYLLIPEWKTS